MRIALRGVMAVAASRALFQLWPTSPWSRASWSVVSSWQYPLARWSQPLRNNDGMAQAGLPDPRDRNLAWWNGEPAYLAWWRTVSSPDGDRDLPSPRELIRFYSYAIPTLRALQTVAGLGPLVELGAGAGYWSRLLRDLGADVVAYDIEPPSVNGWITDAPAWTEVRTGDERGLAAHADRALFVSWPERPDGFMSRVLDTYPPRTLALITDGRVSFQPTDSLYDRLAVGWDQIATVDIPRWPGRFDALTIWRGAAGAGVTP